MTDIEIILGLEDDGSPVVMVGEEETEVTTIAALLAAAPGLTQPPAAAATARAINHLAQNAAFDVIEDPAAYEAQYRARLAQEDHNAPWAEGVMRLCDYGVPDFARIAAPAITDGQLVFFAANVIPGLPYRIAADLTGPDVAVGDANYTPMDLMPLDTEASAETPQQPETE